MALALVGMYPVTVSIFAIAKFSYSSFGVYLSGVSGRVSNLFLTLTVY